MGKGFMKYLRIRHLALLGPGILLAFLFAKTQAIDFGEHTRYSADLRQLKQWDTTLNQDLLKSRYGLLPNYDALTTDTVELADIQDRLETLPTFIDAAGRSHLEQILLAHNQAMTLKQQALERFKSASATLKNSLDYFPLLVTELINQAPNTTTSGDLSLVLNTLLRHALLYALTGADEQIPLIRRQLDLLTQNRERYTTEIEGRSLNLITAHTKAILQYKPQVDNLLVYELLAQPTQERADELLTAYNDQYERALRTTNRYRLGLFLCALGLLAFVARMIFRLRNTTEALQRSEDRTALVLHATQDGIWDWNITTNEVYFSKEFKAQLEYEEQEFPPGFASFESHLYPEDHDRVHQALRDHLEHHTPYHLEFRLRTKSGAYRWFDVYGQAEWNEQRQPIRMTGTHRDITERKHTEEQLQMSAERLATSSRQIMTSLTQVVANTTETATAISQTATTISEVKQTAYLSSQKSQQVSENAQHTAAVSLSGQQAVEHAITGLHKMQEQMESIARSVAKLGEQSQTIGEIIATVNDLAEQSNLLAINAAIEAAKAGDQGKGFAVVAQEVRALATQSKRATAQVRVILTDIRKAASEAVAVTTQGTQSIEAGVQQSIEANQSIQTLAQGIVESAQAVTQIAASSQQQIIGMDQIGVAIESVKTASQQNVAGMRQIEAAVQDLHGVGQALQALVEQYATRNGSGLIRLPSQSRERKIT
jgi:PAS domain S-box-containing protein